MGLRVQECGWASRRPSEHAAEKYGDSDFEACVSVEDQRAWFADPAGVNLRVPKSIHGWQRPGTPGHDPPRPSGGQILRTRNFRLAQDALDRADAWEIRSRPLEDLYDQSPGEADSAHATSSGVIAAIAARSARRSSRNS
ncbi:hypothetical protein GCM10023217_33060 [Gordonia alkaliphila]|uniref:Uncharacterized protein n=1 Tax=Gordonia alkaliphila TaxID=1053547 RepID=A0ABP8ZJV1_9ACTN